MGLLVIAKKFLEKKVRSAGDRSQRKTMIEKDHPDISVRRQCKLLEVNCNRLKPRKTKVDEQDELIMKNLDEIYTKWPFYGQRKLCHELRKYDWGIGRKRTCRLI